MLLVLAPILSACTVRAAPLPVVDLSVRTPLPSAAQAEIIPLRLGVAAIISPVGTVESYDALAHYLGERLGRPVELVQRRTYTEMNDLIEVQAVDLAFVCTSAYIEGRDRFGMELLVAPQVNGQTVYHSDLIVPTTSHARSMADLRGRVFAFTDPISFSGRVYPTYLLQTMGETPEHFFSRTFFTYSHEKAIQAVAAGVADGAAVDSLVLEYAFRRDPSLAQTLRVIHRSPPFGIPPVVVPPGLPIHQKALLLDLLLTMHQDPIGRGVLKELGIDRFVPIDDSAYAGVRELTARVGRLP
ncbi:MAG: phosphate/phosphite/phosphonate ABC transporter substrate-binding protein [Anaerolineae bacterium]|nr:phosphate/phosphite/phosphonate ABC transporter substrate-binding protein [Caldilineales bacterium]MCX7853383.1 phosphate/phosphite/phosphonate ABC transporter substrate-binding protein [Caldilineales bacterium]MDW8268593.1 phosphate/phosphite/phosphonate ABC transporter substrate-binding protein [Anaerolineae bacterium]